MPRVCLRRIQTLLPRRGHPTRQHLIRPLFRLCLIHIPRTVFPTLVMHLNPGRYYTPPFAHRSGQDSPDSQPNTGYLAISADDETASASRGHSWHYNYPIDRRIVHASPDPSRSDSSDRGVVSPGPSRPGPLHRMSSGISGQPGLLGVRRVRRSSQATRPHPYRDDGTANRSQGRTRDIGP